jgi:hypothetical protein
MQLREPETNEFFDADRNDASEKDLRVKRIEKPRRDMRRIRQHLQEAGIAQELNRRIDFIAVSFRHLISRHWT